jgi:hypothetical protein
MSPPPWRDRESDEERKEHEEYLADKADLDRKFQKEQELMND